MPSAFANLLGYTQGRITPGNSTPVDGVYVFCLGSDAPGQHGKFNLNDSVRVEQSCDVTGVRLVRFSIDLRGPVVAVPGAAWLVTWGVDGVVQGSKLVPVGRRYLFQDGALDTSQLIGAHILQFALKVVAG